MASHKLRRSWLLVGLALAVVLAFIPNLAQSQGTTPPASQGSYYVVQLGDNWSMIAWRNGLQLWQLRAANPQYIRPGDVLWPGDRLFIPLAPGVQAAGTAPSGTGYWYITRQGDTWQTVARDAGVTVLDLWHANPAQLNRNRTLYAGVRLWIPAAPSPTPTEAPARPAVQAPAAAPTMAPTNTPAPTPTITATEALPATGVTPPAATPSTASTSGTNGCPAQFSDYPAAIADRLNAGNTTADSVRSWLASCGAITDEYGAVIEASIQSKASDDYLAIVSDPKSKDPTSPDRLLVYHGQPSGGYALAGMAQGQGKIAVLRVADINGDGKTDIVWTDTACITAACQSTLFVDSWDGTAYRSFIEGQPVTTAAQYSLQPVPGSNTYDIIIRSGPVGSPGAQIVTYVSTNGGLYHALPAGATPAPTSVPAAVVPPSPTESSATQVVPLSQAGPNTTATPAAPAQNALATPAEASAPPAAPTANACLFNELEGADQTFDSWPSAGFAPAIQAYQAIVDDTTSRACGQVKDELTLLHDFARFRLMVAMSGNGRIAQTSGVRDQITTPALKAAADAFLGSYQSSHSLIQACRDVSTYAGAHPESWHFMVDLGDAKFTADDLCPLAK